MISSSIRATLSLPQTRKGRWLNPEQSVGNHLGIKKRKYHYWEAEGPAREAFEQIKPQIKEVLESACAPVPGGSRFISFKIFMIGETPETAVPHIMFSCEHPNSRKIAMNLIKESKILDQSLSGICLGHWSYPPHLKNLRFLSSSKISTAQGNERNFSLCDYSPIPGSNSKVSRENLVLQLEVKSPSGYLCRATIGGIVEVSARQFYFAPAHVFSSQCNTSQDMPSEETYPQSDDSECEFGGFDGGDDSLADDHEAEVMSQYSVTPESSHPDHDLDPNCTESSSDVASDTLNSEAQFETHRNSALAPDDGAHHLHEVGVPLLPQSDGLDVNFHFFKSEDLDYCLIEVDKNKGYSSSLPILSHANIGQLDNEDVRVTALTGSGNVLKGVLSGRPSCIRLPSAMRYIDVFSVQFEGFLQPGDSGSIVRDANTEKVYGHIIAGDTESHNALIVPAVDVLADMMENSRRIETLSSNHNLSSALSTLDIRSPLQNVTQSTYTIPPSSFTSPEDSSFSGYDVQGYIHDYPGSWSPTDTTSLTSWDYTPQQDFEVFNGEFVQHTIRPEVHGSDLDGIGPRFDLPIPTIPQNLDLQIRGNIDRTLLGIAKAKPVSRQQSYEDNMGRVMNVFRSLNSNQPCSYDEVTKGIESLEALKTYFKSKRGESIASSSGPVDREGERDRDIERYQCLLCEVQKNKRAIIPSFGSLRRHLATTHEIYDSEFRCLILDCAKTFSRRDRMREHLTLVHKMVDLKAADVEATRVRVPPPTLCPICPETIQSWDAFFRHIKNHSLLRPVPGGA